MNHNELLNELSCRLGCTEKDAVSLVASFLDIVTEELQEGKNVELGNFGELKVEKQMEKIVVNTSTGQRFLVPPKLDVTFELNHDFRKRLTKRLSHE